MFPDPNNFDGELAIWTDASDQPELVKAVGSTSSRGTGVLELARAIRAGVPERANGEQAYHVVDVMVSIAEAAESGEWVDRGEHRAAVRGAAGGLRPEGQDALAQDPLAGSCVTADS